MNYIRVRKENLTSSLLANMGVGEIFLQQNICKGLRK